MTRRWREGDSNPRSLPRLTPLRDCLFAFAEFPFRRRDRPVSREGPAVRIHFPPALSPLRTSFSGGKRGKVRGDLYAIRDDLGAVYRAVRGLNFSGRLQLTERSRRPLPVKQVWMKEVRQKLRSIDPLWAPAARNKSSRLQHKHGPIGPPADPQLCASSSANWAG